jgi:hypothetical protein
MRPFLRSLLGCLVLGVMAIATASAEECSGTITAEEVLRAEDARYAAQIANDFTGFFELDLTVSGAPLSEQVRFHSLWAKRGQSLQFVSWQSTRVPPKQ